MSKHTPGPWGLMPDNPLQITYMVGHPDPLYHVEVNGYNREECEANARLIASAPTMYARIAALEEEIASAKELARNNAERSNANYVAMKDAQDERDSLLEFIDLTIERREAFADYSARIKGE